MIDVMQTESTNIKKNLLFRKVYSMRMHWGNGLSNLTWPHIDLSTLVAEKHPGELSSELFYEIMTKAERPLVSIRCGISGTMALLG